MRRHKRIRILVPNVSTVSAAIVTALGCELLSRRYSSNTASSCDTYTRRMQE